MTDIIWHTEKRKVKDLIPYAHNPRTMSSDQVRHLMESIDKFNYVELVVIQPDNRIIAGHMRINVLKKQGRSKEDIEVRVPNRTLSDDEMREYLIRSNKNTGDWDWDCLADNFDPHDLHLWGFTYDELVGAVADIKEKLDSLDDDDRCGECGQKIKKPKNKGKNK